MGCDRDINAYYWPEYQKVESGTWKFQNYDTNGNSPFSLMGIHSLIFLRWGYNIGSVGW